jgi:pimeloyl-ACP methyl ester carboxylesterase
VPPCPPGAPAAGSYTLRSLFAGQDSNRVRAAGVRAWFTRRMQTTRSADGTPIAWESIGDDSAPAALLVGGAFGTADAARPLAAALADVGLRGVVMDRRGRGGSGDTRPYEVLREVEDLAAVIRAAGNVRAVLGHSSGAILTLRAAAAGLHVDHLFLSEPPFAFDTSRPPQAPDLVERLQECVDDGRPEDAVRLFQLEAVGLPAETVAQIAASPVFPALVAVAQSCVYDATITAASPVPTPAMAEVSTPTTVLRGGRTWPFLEVSTDALAALLPDASLVVVPESLDHALHPEGTAREVRAALD